MLDFCSSQTWVELKRKVPYFCVLQRVEHREEEAAYLPHRGLWEGVWENVAPASPPALAFRGATFRLQLDVLWEEVHTQRRAAEAQENAHR